MTDKIKNISLSPLRIAVIYLVVAALWIAFTDQILNALITDSQYLSTLQTYKGWFYVIVTSLGLFYLIKKYDSQISSRDEALRDKIEELKSEQELFDTLFDRIPVMVSIYNPKMAEFEANREFEKITGWKNEELPEINLLKKLYPDNNTRREVMTFMDQPGTGWKEFSMTNKSGETIPTSWTNVQLTDNTSVGIGIDMSEVKANEAKISESRELLRKTIESLRESVILLDPTSRTIIECNQRTEELFGYSYNELMGGSTEKLHLNEENFQKFNDLSQPALESDGVFQTEFEMRRKDGSTFYSDHTVTVVRDKDSSIDKVVSVIKDITDQKRYKEKLKIQNRKLEHAQKEAGIGYWEIDLKNDSDPVWSDNLYKIYGLDKDDYSPTNESFYEMMHSENPRSFEKLQQDLLTNKTVEDWYRIVKPNGKIGYYRAKNELLTDKEGNPSKILGIIQDITELKQAEEELRESEEKYRHLFENNPEPMCIYNPDTLEFVEVNQAMIDHYGYSAEEFSSITIKDITPPEDIENVKKDIEKHRGKTSYSEGWVHIIKDGTHINVELSAADIRYKDNTHRILLINDVTQQKMLEDKLRIQNKKLEKAQRIARVGYWEFDLKNDNTELLWSPNLSRIYGLPDDYQPTVESFMSMLPPEVLPNFEEFKNEIIQQESTEDMFQLEKPNGEVGFYHSRNELILDDDGNPSKLLGIVHELTDLKQAEKELAKEKQRFQLVAETSSDVIWDLDFKTQELWWSEGFEETFGHKRGEPTENYQAWKNYIHPDDKEKITKSSDQALNSDAREWKEEYRLIKSDGSTAYMVDRAVIIRDKDGNATRMVGTMDDITEQKLAEQKLRESEEKYRHLFENNPEPMWIYNPDNLKFVEVNHAAIEHYGYSEEEFLEMTLLDIRPDEDAEALKENVSQNSGRKSYSEEWAHLKKDGSEIKVEISATDVQYQGETHRLVLVNDVTEQRRMQEKIIQSVIEGEDRERKRIAHELHDGLGQYLVAASMNLQSAKTDADKLPKKRKKQLETGLSLLNNALLETRSIAYNLMPKAIADYGLITALENLVKDLQKSTEIDFQFEHNCDNLNLNNQYEINIYRIFQEITSNAIRHAECSVIAIELQLNEDTLTLIIRDDGIGAKLDDEDEENGLGLRSIKSRVNNLKGNLDIVSRPDEGMKTSITIPNIHNLKSSGAT